MAAQQKRTDVEALIAEVERYLAAVDTFRAAGCEPHWRFEYPRPNSRSVTDLGALTLR